MRALLAAAVLVPLLAGCAGCQPQLDVRHCLPGSELCAPRPGGPEAAWNATHAAAWPDVDQLLRGTAAGGHAHAPWTEETERAWWAYWGVDPETEEKELFVHHDGGLFRVRVLSC